jgi:hypothetical protein
MLQQMKSGTVKVALMLTLGASMFAVGNAQAVDIPLPASEPKIAEVIANVRVDGSVKAMMNEVRAGVIENMSNRAPDELPLRNQVQGKLMPMMMGKILPVQLKAMANPNGGFPGMIAPPPF